MRGFGPFLISDRIKEVVKSRGYWSPQTMLVPDGILDRIEDVVDAELNCPYVHPDLMLYKLEYLRRYVYEKIKRFGNSG